MFENQTILITGGTGSFGRAFAQKILYDYPEVKKFIVFSRDELKQQDMALSASFFNNQKIRYFIGDIRDKNRLYSALNGVDIVVHAAALKQVPTAEYNPMEVIKTNVIGIQNLIEASIHNNVKKLVSLSTDKAAAPINLYGASKLCADKIVTASKQIVGDRPLILATVRYGNVFGSRGSVVPFFLKKKSTGVLPITSPKMTRFSITLDQAVDMVLWSLRKMEGGEIFVPKIPSYRIIDLAEAVSPECTKKTVGIRPGEKIHEEMITESDSFSTVDLGEYFAILPYQDLETKKAYCIRNNGHLTNPGWSYNSGANREFLTVDQLKEEVAKWQK